MIPFERELWIDLIREKLEKKNQKDKVDFAEMV